MHKTVVLKLTVSLHKGTENKIQIYIVVLSEHHFDVNFESLFGLYVVAPMAYILTHFFADRQNFSTEFAEHHHHYRSQL